MTFKRMILIMDQLKLLLKSLFILTLLVQSLSYAAELAGFKTEPTFTPEKFRIKTLTSNSSSLAPGYIFLGPLNNNWSYGPQIYTQAGELVWYGNSTSFFRAQDFKTCDYFGQRGNHLCWHEAKSRHGHKPIGYKVVFDNTYSQVGQNYSKAGNRSFPNSHEFRMLSLGKAFLQTVYEPRKMDLRPYTGPKDGWVFDGCFQEIATRDGSVSFQWCYLQNQLPVWESRLFLAGPGQTNISSVKAGSGHFDEPWDFMHVNSVDKNSEGDYLVSSRYLNQILKIAGPENVLGLSPGSIVWRLGGVANQFKKNFTFSRQHSARYLQTDASGDTLAILDNAWDGYTPASAERSSGKIIRINNKTDDMSAILLREFPSPERTPTKAQGGLQLLDNGNLFFGWGVRPQFSEYSPEGELLYHVRFQRYSYRTFKSPWVGKPHWKPKILSYKRSCGHSPLSVYVSWNGATEVAHWRFQVSPFESGPWYPAGAFVKGSEFETYVRLLDANEATNSPHGFPRYVLVEALDSEFKVLGNTVGATFVPNSRIRTKHKCDWRACQKPLSFVYDVKLSIAESTCGRPMTKPAFVVLMLVIIIEGLEKTMDILLFQYP